jgi:hypothetical protein
LLQQRFPSKSNAPANLSNCNRITRRIMMSWCVFARDGRYSRFAQLRILFCSCGRRDMAHFLSQSQGDSSQPTSGIGQDEFYASGPSDRFDEFSLEFNSQGSQSDFSYPDGEFSTSQQSSQPVGWNLSDSVPSSQGDANSISDMVNSAADLNFDEGFDDEEHPEEPVVVPEHACRYVTFQNSFSHYLLPLVVGIVNASSDGIVLLRPCKPIPPCVFSALVLSDLCFQLLCLFILIRLVKLTCPPSAISVTAESTIPSV